MEKRFKKVIKRNEDNMKDAFIGIFGASLLAEIFMGIIASLKNDIFIIIITNIILIVIVPIVLFLLSITDREVYWIEIE